MTTVDVRTDAGALPADLHLPAGGRGPGIVLFQEIFGVTPYVTERAGDLAALGYVVLVPHVYWRQGDPVIDELPAAMEAMGRVVWDEAVADGAAAVAALRDRPEVDGPAGVLGFCFGGGLAYAVAASTPVDFLVSWYGSALPDLLDAGPAVTAPSLHHFGLSDDYLRPDVVARMEATLTAAGATVLTYAGAGHAFDNPAPEFHSADASRAAWGATVAWLAEHAPTGAPRTRG